MISGLPDVLALRMLMLFYIDLVQILIYVPRSVQRYVHIPEQTYLTPFHHPHNMGLCLCIYRISAGEFSYVTAFSRVFIQHSSSILHIAFV